MKQIIILNALWGGDNVAPCITAHYHKAGERDLYPDNAFCPHIAILEMEIMEEARPIQVAQIYDQEQNPINGRVYSQDGIAPTLLTPTGGLSEPKIMEYVILTPKRTEKAKELRRQGIEVFANRELVPREDGCSNTITTLQKDNLLRDPCIIGYSRDHKGNVQSRHEKDCANTIHTHSGSGGNTDQFVKEMVIGSMQANAMHGSLDCVSPCLTEAMGTGGGQIPMVTIRYRIRKLTERECFRLMGMDDADIDKIDAYRIRKTLKNGKVKDKPIPKSQKYKLAGNSIVVSCLYHIFKGMFIDEKPKLPPKQLDLFDDLWHEN